MMFLPPFVLILFKKLVCFLFFKELLLIFTFKSPSFLLGVADSTEGLPPQAESLLPSFFAIPKSNRGY